MLYANCIYTSILHPVVKHKDKNKQILSLRELTTQYYKINNTPARMFTYLNSSLR